MLENRTIKNDGQKVAFKLLGQEIPYPYKGETGTLKLREVWTPDKPNYGWGRISITHDWRVRVHGYVLSDPMDETICRQIAETLGLTLELDNPRERVQHLRDEKGDLTRGWKAIMEMAGFKNPNPGPMGGERYESENGLVFAICNRTRHPDVAPVLAREVRYEASKLIAAANRWLREFAPGFKRNVKLAPYEVVELHKRSKNRHFRVVRVNVGDTVNIPEGGSSYFGSGGGWSRWDEYGQITKVWDESKTRDNGFTVRGEYTVTFDHGPAMVFTARGDAINDGRVFDYTLYIAE